MATYRTTFSNLNSLLQSLPANSTSTPYEIEITEITNEQCKGGASTADGTLQYVLQQNKTKYVSLTISNNLITTIGESCFRKCKNLKRVNIPNSVTQIKSFAFSECTELATVYIPNSVTSIKDRAFMGCSNLVSIILPSSITTIEERTFQLCTNLLSVDIPNSVTSIKEMAFENCTKLTSITIPNTIKTIEKSVFSNAGLISIDIPNSVTQIESDAFYKCSLTSITIPTSVTSIGSFAFASCPNLTNVIFPHTLDELQFVNLGSYIFLDDSTLATVHLYDEATKAKFISEYASSFGLTGKTYVVDHIAYTESTGLFSNFESALVYLDANSPSTKYKFHLIELNQNRISGADTATEGTIQYTLQQNPTKYVSIEEDVSCYQGNITSMQKAFKNCTNLVKFSGFPNGVTNLNECFSGCTNLSEVT